MEDLTMNCQGGDLLAQHQSGLTVSAIHGRDLFICAYQYLPVDGKFILLPPSNTRCSFSFLLPRKPRLWQIAVHDEDSDKEPI
jgi:hypothetical protein